VTLRVTFRTVPGETAVHSRARCFRFCADGTLRAGDNSVAARRVDDGWRLAQRQFRELECEGPVVLRSRKTAAANPVDHGPFNLVRTESGLVYGDDVCLDICLPTLNRSAADSWHEVSFLPVATPGVSAISRAVR
jgi:hypothetical protein